MPATHTVKHPFSAKVVNTRPPTHEVFKAGESIEVLQHDGSHVVFRRPGQTSTEFEMQAADFGYKAAELVHT